MEILKLTKISIKDDLWSVTHCIPVLVSPPMKLRSFFFNVYFSERERERQSMSRGGAEREGDTESEAGSRL